MVPWMRPTDRGSVLASWQRHWRGLLIFGLATIIAVAPIGVTYVTNPFTFMNRVSEISIFNEVKQAGTYQPLLDNIEDHLKFSTGLGTGMVSIICLENP
jgi:hypothetical protein